MRPVISTTSPPPVFLVTEAAIEMLPLPPAMSTALPAGSLPDPIEPAETVMALVLPAILSPDPATPSISTLEKVTAPLAPLSSMPSPPVPSMVVVEKLKVAAEPPSIRIPSDAPPLVPAMVTLPPVKVSPSTLLRLMAVWATVPVAPSEPKVTSLAPIVTPFQLTTCPVVVVTLLPLPVTVTVVVLPSARNPAPLRGVDIEAAVCEVDGAGIVEGDGVVGAGVDGLGAVEVIGAGVAVDVDAGRRRIGDVEGAADGEGAGEAAGKLDAVRAAARTDGFERHGQRAALVDIDRLAGTRNRHVVDVERADGVAAVVEAGGAGAGRDVDAPDGIVDGDIDALVAIGGDVDGWPRAGVRDVDGLAVGGVGELQRLARAVELLAVLKIEAIAGIGAGAGAQHDEVVDAGSRRGVERRDRVERIG